MKSSWQFHDCLNDHPISMEIPIKIPLIPIEIPWKSMKIPFQLIPMKIPWIPINHSEIPSNPYGNPILIIRTTSFRLGHQQCARKQRAQCEAIEKGRKHLKQTRQKRIGTRRKTSTVIFSWLKRQCNDSYSKCNVFFDFLLQNLLQISNVPILLFSTNQKFPKHQNTVYCNILYCTALCSMSCAVLLYLCRMPSNSIVKVSSAPKNAVLGDAQLVLQVHLEVVILGLQIFDQILCFSTIIWVN